MKKYASLLKISLSVLLFSIFIFNACEDSSTSTPVEKTNISGIIADEQNVPVPNAIVQAISNGDELDSDTTNVDGEFTLEGIPETMKSVTLRISHTDFKEFERELNKVVTPDNKNNVSVKILHKDDCCGKVEINVLDKKNEKPLKGVEVRLNRKDEVVRKSLTNEEGNLVFENLCEGSYWLRFAKEGYQVEERKFTMEECDSISYNILMNDGKSEEDPCCDGIIWVLPKDKKTDEIVKGAKVILYKDGKAIEHAYVKDGAVGFDNLCEGKYTVVIKADHYKADEFHVELGCNKEEEVVRFLEKTTQKDSCCDGVLYIIPKDKKSGEALNGAKVRLWKDGDLVKKVKVENGYAKFTDLCEGKYGVDILAEGYSNIEFHVEMGCDEEKEVVKYLEKEEKCEGKIYVVVKDKDGNPIQNAEVRLWKGSKKIAVAKTNEKGIAVFEGVCEGEYQISILHEDYNGMEFNFTMEGNSDEKEFHKELEKKSGDPCYTAKMKIIVKDKSNGEPIEGAKVVVKVNGETKYDGETNGDGVYLEDGMKAPETYVVTISKVGYKSITFEWKFKECKLHQETFKLEKE